MAKGSGTTRALGSRNPQGGGSASSNKLTFTKRSMGLIDVSGRDVNDIAKLGIMNTYVERPIEERYGNIRNGGGTYDGSQTYSFDSDAGEKMISNYIKDWAEGARLLQKYNETQSAEATDAYNNWVAEYRLKTRRLNGRR